MAIAPCVKKLFCRSTMALLTPQDGVEALLDVLHEPARFLQPRRHGAAGAALAAHGLRRTGR
jgi:hypothetical protein